MRGRRIALSWEYNPALYAPARYQLEQAGVLLPLSASKRNKSWEALGMLDLLANLETGQLPDP